MNIDCNFIFMNVDRKKTKKNGFLHDLETATCLN